GRAARRRLRRAESAAIGGALPRPPPFDRQRVLHVERRAVSVSGRPLAAVLRQRRGAADRRAEHVHPRLLQHPGARVPFRAGAAGAGPAVGTAAESDSHAARGVQRRAYQQLLRRHRAVAVAPARSTVTARAMAAPITGRSTNRQVPPVAPASVISRAPGSGSGSRLLSSPTTNTGMCAR